MYTQFHEMGFKECIVGMYKRYAFYKVKNFHRESFIEKNKRMFIQNTKIKVQAY